MSVENVSAAKVSPTSQNNSNSSATVTFRSPGMMVGSLTPYERDVLPFIRPFTDVLASQVPAGDLRRHLDHGAGTGEVILQLERTHMISESVALDPSPVMASRLQEIFGHPVTSHSRVVDVVHGTLTSYLDNGPIEPFDLITSQLVLPFVPDPGGEL